MDKKENYETQRGHVFKSPSIQALLKSFLALVTKHKMFLMNYWALHLSDLFCFRTRGDAVNHIDFSKVVNTMSHSELIGWDEDDGE